MKSDLFDLACDTAAGWCDEAQQAADRGNEEGAELFLDLSRHWYSVAMYHLRYDAAVRGTEPNDQRGAWSTTPFNADK